MTLATHTLAISLGNSEAEAAAIVGLLCEAIGRTPAQPPSEADFLAVKRSIGQDVRAKAQERRALNAAANVAQLPEVT